MKVSGSEDSRSAARRSASLVQGSNPRALHKAPEMFAATRDFLRQSLGRVIESSRSMWTRRHEAARRLERAR